MDSDVKSYIDAKLKELREEIKSNIIVPLGANLKTIGDVIDRYDEIKNKVDKFEKEGNKVTSDATSQAELPSFNEIMDDSLNLMAIPFLESMKFVVLIMTLVERKLETVQIKDRIVNDYGNIMGRLYMESLNDVIQQTNKKNVKKTCSDILDMMRGESPT